MNGMILIVTLIVLIILFLFLLSRGKETQARLSKVQARNQEEVEKAQKKRDEQIELMKELVSLSRQQIENQNRILELLNQR